MTIALPSIVPDNDYTKEIAVDNIAGYIARQYQLNFDYAKKITMISFDAANSYSVDPKLVLAFIAEQSSFNPLSGSTTGGKGLTQIVPRWFNISNDLLSEKGESNFVDVENNIVIGISVLKSLMDNNKGNLKKAIMDFNKVDEVTAQKLESIVNNVYLRLKQAEDGKIQPVNNN
jgi:soluble lytic murein transglycosylase-like protein